MSKETIISDQGVDNLSPESLEAKELGKWLNLLRKYKVKNTRKIIRQVITSFLPFLALRVGMYLLWEVSIVAVRGIGIVNAFFLVRIFIIQHDCGHQSYSNNKKFNAALGVFASFFSIMPFFSWRKNHNFHHANNGVLETKEIGDTPTLTVTEYQQKSKRGKFKYQVVRFPLVLFVIAPVVYLLILCRFNLNFKILGRKAIKLLLLDNIPLVVVYTFLAILLGWKFLVTQGIVLLFFGIIAFWFFYVQHQHEHGYKERKTKREYLLASLKGSTHYNISRIGHRFTGNIGYHHIHHLGSFIPNYNLRQCYNENPILQKYVTSVTFRQSLSMLGHRLWDEKTSRMISFAEYKKNFVNKGRASVTT